MIIGLILNLKFALNLEMGGYKGWEQVYNVKEFFI